MPVAMCCMYMIWWILCQRKPRGQERQLQSMRREQFKRQNILSQKRSSGFSQREACATQYRPRFGACKVQVYLNGELALEKKKKSAAPGEMEQILIPENVFEKVAEIKEIRLQMEEL